MSSRWTSLFTAGTPAEAAAGAASAGAAGEAGAAGAAACGEGAEHPYSAEQVDCCVAVVKAAFPGGLSEPAPEALTAEQAGCCRVLLETRDQQDPAAEGAVPWELAYPCCPFVPSASQDGFSPTCTPWGPPTPPAMDPALWGEERWLGEVA